MTDETAIHPFDRNKEPNIMRKLLIALPLTAILGLSTLALSSPAFAYGPLGGNSVIYVTVSTSPSGVITVQVTGGPFDCGETVNVSATNSTAFLGSTVAYCTNGSGSISATFQVPGGYPAGSHDMIAVGATSGDTGSATWSTSATAAGASPCTSSAHSGQAHAIVLASCLSSIPPAAVGGNPSSAAGAPSAIGSPKSGAVGATSQSSLPLTGADVVGITTAGAGAVLVGGLAVLASRRKRADRF